MNRQIAAAAAQAVLVSAAILIAAQAHAESVDVAFSPDGGAEQLVLQTIGEARSSIRVMAYSFTSRTVVAALVAAHRRGIDIAVTVDYRNNVTDDHSHRARATLNSLVYAGIPVRTVDAFDLQHSKYLLVDNATVETGSFNYSQQAARFNSENVVVIHGAPAVASAYAANWRDVTAKGVLYSAP
ncbi:phospholipase D-like domain-containing protein [Paraburkholderia kururiensis]|uniref:phospholipase D-like domain-containing protein n=1 Tax=Paraburkholderia kururiensis TaxID=984307 RepID=UPI00069346F7|nr:phospholipase D-like domain-containing protein [Paraburkholderia kururiensis]